MSTEYDGLDPIEASDASRLYPTEADQPLSANEDQVGVVFIRILANFDSGLSLGQFRRNRLAEFSSKFLDLGEGRLATFSKLGFLVGRFREPEGFLFDDREDIDRRIEDASDLEATTSCLPRFVTPIYGDYYAVIHPG